jgi:hypothetical protein
MAKVTQKARIFGALVIAGVLIGGSLFFSYGNLNFLNPSIANAASTQALLQELATRSSSGDGLPDWEAELYGLDPNNSHSFSPTITDAQAVAEGLIKPKFLTPSADSDSTDASSSDDTDQLEGVDAAPGSLTDQFSQILLQQYLSQSADAANNDTEPSEEDVDTAAQSALQTFAVQNEHQNEYSMSQIQQGGSGPEAMKEYAAAAETIFSKNEMGASESELDYFSAAVEKNDTSAIPHLSQIGSYYTTMAPELMEISVPVEAQNAHLALVNAMSHLGADITDMSMLNSDPLRAYFGLAQYQTDSQSLATAFAAVGNVFTQEQVTLSPDQKGAAFIQYTESTETSAANDSADTPVSTNS